MRNRLVAALAGMTVAVIALYGVPRAYFLADLVQEQEQRRIAGSVDLVAAAVAERQQGAAPVTRGFLEGLASSADSIRYVGPDGKMVTAGATPSGQGAIAETRNVAGGGQVTMATTEAAVRSRVSQALMPLVVLGLGLTALSAVVGWLLARRLASPFQELADAASRLGRGDFRMDLGHFAVPEANEIAEALRRSARELDDLLRRERDSAVNASHELRSPVTALRLQLEDLAMWPQTAPEVAEEINAYVEELDRLSEAIDHHLDRARTHRTSRHVDVDLDRLAAETVRRWDDVARASGRRLVHEQSRPLFVRLDPDAVGQILDALVENAICHGEGTVTVETRDAGDHGILLVRDEGVRRLDSGVFHGSAAQPSFPDARRSLAVAAETAEVLGGHLSLGSDQLTTFTLRVPKRR